MELSNLMQNMEIQSKSSAPATSYYANISFHGNADIYYDEKYALLDILENLNKRIRVLEDRLYEIENKSDHERPILPHF